MPSVGSLFEMVSGVSNLTADQSAREWQSREYTSSGQIDRETQSMARYSIAQNEESDEAMDDATIIQDQSTYWRAREQAHSALADLHEQRQRQLQYEAFVQSQQQATPRRSSRQPHQHRVYLINCRHCDHFLTDRGMKAVLLLRPHITLYSTDATPNCGPLYPTQPSDDPMGYREPLVERTCNCLTQTLGCYGCGVAVGYHIVSPCSRCTNSVAKHQRSSNGHRTVLHCTEIRVRERRYVPGEEGVMTAKVPYPTSTPKHSTGSRSTLYSQQYDMQRNRRRYSVHEETFADEGANDDKQDIYMPFSDRVYQNNTRAAVSTSASASTFAQSDVKPPRHMRPGDTVYWSDLVTGGERYEPIDCDELLSMPVAGR